MVVVVVVVGNGRDCRFIRKLEKGRKICARVGVPWSGRWVVCLGPNLANLIALRLSASTVPVGVLVV